MRDRIGAHMVLMVRPDGDNIEYLGVDGRIILKWTFKWDEAWIGVIWPKTGAGDGRL
jgi:hypothetical protein